MDRLPRLLTAFLLVLCRSCAPPPARVQSAREAEVTRAALEGWDAAGLDLPGRCEERAYTFAILEASQEDFDRLCAGSGSEWGCFQLAELEGGRFHSGGWYPQAVFSPRAVAAGNLVVGRMAVHEMLHYLVSCATDRPITDPYDHYHADARVWSVSNLEEHDTSTAQWLAFKALGQP